MLRVYLKDLIVYIILLLATYEHVAGCKEGGIECDLNGYQCGGAGYCQGDWCTFSKCKEVAAKDSKDGFYYNPQGMFYKERYQNLCKHCTMNQIASRSKIRSGGVYAKQGTYTFMIILYDSLLKF